jgi:hypothetical protein
MQREFTGQVVMINTECASFVDDVSTAEVGDCPKNVLLCMHVENLRPRLEDSRARRFGN